jgi:hypothetical protein
MKEAFAGQRKVGDVEAELVRAPAVRKSPAARELNSWSCGRCTNFILPKMMQFEFVQVTTRVTGLDLDHRSFVEYAGRNRVLLP